MSNTKALGCKAVTSSLEVLARSEHSFLHNKYFNEDEAKSRSPIHNYPIRNLVLRYKGCERFWLTLHIFWAKHQVLIVTIYCQVFGDWFDLSTDSPLHNKHLPESWASAFIHTQAGSWTQVFHRDLVQIYYEECDNPSYVHQKPAMPNTMSLVCKVTP